MVQGKVIIEPDSHYKYGHDKPNAIKREEYDPFFEKT